MSTPRNSGGKTGPDYFISWDSNSVFLSLEEITDQEKAPCEHLAITFGWVCQWMPVIPAFGRTTMSLILAWATQRSRTLNKWNKICCKPDIEVYNLRMRHRQKDHAFKVPSYVVSERLPQKLAKQLNQPRSFKRDIFKWTLPVFLLFVPLYR